MYGYTRVCVYIYAYVNFHNPLKFILSTQRGIYKLGNHIGPFGPSPPNFNDFVSVDSQLLINEGRKWNLTLSLINQGAE